MMIKVAWYSLKDVFSGLGYLPASNVEAEKLPFLTVLSSYSLELDPINYDGLDATQQTSANALINELMKVVYVKYAEWHCLKKEMCYYSDVIPTLSNDDIKDLLLKFINIINMTFKRYWILFNSYKKYQDDPTAKMESSDGSVTRFNDTPQNTGLYGDDSHTSHITEYEHNSSMDSASIMKRLEEVNDNWRSILYAWSNEFKGLFIKED